MGRHSDSSLLSRKGASPHHMPGIEEPGASNGQEGFRQCLHRTCIGVSPRAPPSVRVGRLQGRRPLTALISDSSRRLCGGSVGVASMILALVRSRM